MKRILYYVVEKELTGVDDNTGCEETTGNKEITMYTIENGELVKFGDIECQNTDNSKMMIEDYLEDNGYSDELFELKQL